MGDINEPGLEVAPITSMHIQLPNYREEAQNTHMVYHVPQKKKKALWRKPGSVCHIYLAILFQNQERCSRKVLQQQTVYGQLFQGLWCA